MFGKILHHKITFGISVALVVAVVLVGGYYLLFPGGAQYETAVAAPRDIQESVTASGMVDSDQNVSLSFRSAGTVAAVNVSVGDHVTAGEVLASLDNSALQILATVQNGATSARRAPSTARAYPRLRSALSTARETTRISRIPTPCSTRPTSS